MEANKSSSSGRASGKQRFGNHQQKNTEIKKSSSIGQQTLVPSSTSAANVSKQVCNCLGTRHGHVTNCTHCGYILCRYEVNQQQTTTSDDSIITCPNCCSICTLPYNAQQIESQRLDESTIKAYRQKDTLLQYDKEHAKRTVVHDAQADYYVSSAWLTEDERKELELKERQRLEMKKLARRHKKINIRFDVAGRKIVEANPYEEQPDDENVVVCATGLDEVDIASSSIYDDDDAVTDNSTTGEFIPIFENTELMMRTSKAAEVYRHMRKR